MANEQKFENIESKRCDICRGGNTKDTELYLGPWMHKGNVTVHYHCLLLSTNLPQEGGDTGGINGFFLRHVRAEINAAGKRFCVYCDNVGASIQCNTCNVYFDINCGLRNGCLFQFVGEFKSFCQQCITFDKFQKKARKRLRGNSEVCFICKEILPAPYSPTEQLYAPCCHKGFVHRKCMQIYALKAGYYLRCIWCRSVSFRESIKYQGIFVPDREANWETKTRYRDLHRGHSRCDVSHCKCTRGREYKTSSWNLINCCLCGSSGAHYPQCVPKLKNGKVPSIEEYICETCSLAEGNSQQNAIKPHEPPDNSTEYHHLYLCKSNNKNNNRNPQEVASTTEGNEPAKESIDTSTTTDSEFTVTSTTPELLPCDRNEVTKDDHSDDVEMMSSETETQTFVDLTQTESLFDFEEIEMFDFNEDFEYIGKCKLRINMKSPRFENKTLEYITNHPELFSESDVIERMGDIEPFENVQHLLQGKEGHEFLLEHSPKIE